LFVPDPVREPTALAVSEITATSLPDATEWPRPYADDEIVVWGDRIEVAKKAIANKLESLGYRGHPQGDGRTLWRPTGEDFWKPRVLIDDDGWYTVDTPTASMTGLELGKPVTIGAPDAMSTVEQAPPPPTIGPRFTLTGRRVAKAAEARLVREIEPLVRDLRSAQADAGLAGRLDALPGVLDRLWRDGWDEEGDYYASQDDRQRALLAMWSSRTATRAGETVRVAIERYLEEIVDEEAGLSPALIAEAEVACGCRFGEYPGP
jgi:hypothetical protein